MNKLVVASVIAALAGIPGTSTTARAGGDEAWAAIGGFIGGVVVGSAINNHHHHRYDDRAYCPPPRTHGRIIIDTGSYDHHPRGHWEWVEVRVWVPGYWTFRHDRCGRRVRTWIPGGYEIRRERRWVVNDYDHGYRHHG